MQMNPRHREVSYERFLEKRVQMKGQDVTVGVEAVEGTAYGMRADRPRIGGLTRGSSGKVVCLLSSGIDSRLWAPRMPAAAPPAHRRPFSTPPDFACPEVPGGRHRARARAHRLHRRVLTWCFGDYQRGDILPVRCLCVVIRYRRAPRSAWPRSWRAGKGLARW